MKYSTRIVITLLAVAALHSGNPTPTIGASLGEGPIINTAASATDLAASVPQTSLGSAAVEAPEADDSVPTVDLTVVGGTIEQRGSVDRAVAHFAGAGLELPGISVVIHDTDAGCDGYDGAFRSREWRLDVCNPHWMIVLHELAHAWEYATLTDETRAEFMDMRGLATWNDGATPWKERGVEDLAEVIVWGLQQLAGQHQATPEPEKEAAFRLITGIDIGEKPGMMMGETRSRATQRHDPDDRDPDFDTWK
jgi:hypothetical protein